MGGGDHRVLAAGHIAADGVHRDVFVAEDHAGIGFLLHIHQGGLLDFREVADLRLGELDVLDILFGDLIIAGVDLFPAEAEFLRRPAVELLGIIPERRIAARLDVVENALHGLAHLRLRRVFFRLRNAFLEPARHDLLHSSKPVCLLGDEYGVTPDSSSRYRAFDETARRLQSRKHLLRRKLSSWGGGR